MTDNCGCLLPNLGCLSIPVQYITTTGQQGPPGENGDNGATGNTGATGAAGPSGVYRLYTNVTEQKTAVTASYQTLATYTLAANQLVNNGDSLVISAWSRQDAVVNPQNPPYRQIKFGGQSCTIFTFEPTSLFNGKNLYRLIVELIKTGTTTATCRVQADFLPLNSASSGNQAACFQRDLTGLNFAATNVINYNVLQQIANESVLTSFTIDKITAQ